MQNSYTRLIVRRPSFAERWGQTIPLREAGFGCGSGGAGIGLAKRAQAPPSTSAYSPSDVPVDRATSARRRCDSQRQHRQGVAVDLMPADRPLLRRPTPTSHFFNRLKRRAKTEANSNSLSTTSAICSISTIRSYIRFWTLDYWRGSARRPIGSATVSDLWTSPVRVGRGLPPVWMIRASPNSPRDRSAHALHHLGDIRAEGFGRFQITGDHFVD
jgi:hypothetical protein